MKCLLCLQDKKLIKAHILPEWCFRFLYPDPKNIDSQLVLVSQQKDYAVRRPTGVYDDSILCQECDNKQGKLDDYAKQVFIDRQVLSPPQPSEAYLIENIKGLEVKLFFVSVLWRASISTRDEFLKIDIGDDYKDLFREALFKNSPPREIDIIVGKFDSEKIPILADRHMRVPYRCLLKGLNFWIIYLPRGFKVWVKVDKQKLEEPLTKMVVSDKLNHILISKLGSFECSREFVAMLQMANKIPRPKSIYAP